MSELLPCPFCGKTDIHDRSVRDGRQIFCLSCHGSAGHEFHGPKGDTSERAAAAWNTRAAMPQGEPVASYWRDSYTDLLKRVDTGEFSSLPVSEPGVREALDRGEISNLICMTFGSCDCEADEHGADTSKAKCFKAADAILAALPPAPEARP